MVFFRKIMNVLKLGDDLKLYLGTSGAGPEILSVHAIGLLQNGDPLRKGMLECFDNFGLLFSASARAFLNSAFLTGGGFCYRPFTEGVYVLRGLICDLGTFIGGCGCSITRSQGFFDAFAT